MWAGLTLHGLNRAGLVPYAAISSDCTDVCKPELRQESSLRDFSRWISVKKVKNLHLVGSRPLFRILFEKQANKQTVTKSSGAIFLAKFIWLQIE